MIESETLKGNKQIESIFNNLKEHVIYQDKENRIIWLNKAAADSVGKSQNELIGKFCYEIWHHRTTPCENCPVNRAIKSGISCSGEIMSPDGRWWAISGWPMKDDKGNVIGAIELTLEITELKKTELALKESEKRYRMITENSAMGIYIFQDGKLKFVNDTMCRISGYSEEELLTSDYLKFVHPKFREELRELTELAMKGRFGSLLDPYDFMYLTKSGEARWARLFPRVIEYEGRPAILGNVLHITDYKKIEEALRESKERYRTIFENSATATMIVDENMTILLVNEEAERLTSYSKEEMEGRLTITDIMAVEDRERIAERHARVDWDRIKEFHRVAPRRHEFHLLTKKGEIKECEAIVSLIPGTKEAVVSIIDVTELKKATRELKEMAEEHMMLLDNIDTMVWYAIDPETYGLVNRARAEFLGLKKEEIIGRKLREVLPKEICERCIEGNRRAFSGERVAQEEWMLGPDGRPRCVWITKIPRFGKDGAVERVFCTGTDITQLKDMESALRLANHKLNLLFKVTRHDILNQLAVIQGYLDLMRTPSNKIPLDHYLDKIEYATKRIGEHLEFTREMEDLGKEAPVWMKLSDPIEKALSQLDFEGIEVHLDEKLQHILIFSDNMIWKVFYNLMHNTLEHAKTATRISISANISDRGLDIVYEDNGPGIKKQKDEDIFESSLVRSTGKGLYLIREILSINSMSIEEIGVEGVRFVIHVPPHRFRAG